ncbi:hypothetical protein SAMN05661093_07207 [Kibdelosporangium aridum]|uniref:Uncharacterized protein n=1 Tax=Kibdelosporangium aridum TaxID=2030 RepID=A0A1Y5XZ87_KIBAR|nr:hypothetical protein SAMN05661093_07207 [Kibdelosporangium aridum]
MTGRTRHPKGAALSVRRRSWALSSPVTLANPRVLWSWRSVVISSQWYQLWK